MTQALVISCEGSRQRAAEHIANLCLDDRQWDVTVERHRKTRTLSQNRLYWKWVTGIASAVSEHTGYEPEDVHEYFKQRFLPGRRIEIEGMVAERFTTTKLNTAEMAEYTDKIYRWASQELGLVLPLPPVATEERGAGSASRLAGSEA
jgi:hypothetical protein